MTTTRYTLQILQSGQARAYADTTHVYRLTIEYQGVDSFKKDDEEKKWGKYAPLIPWEKLHETLVIKHLKHFGPWIEKDAGNWASTRLEYMKMVEPGVWEWKTRSAYTD